MVNSDKVLLCFQMFIGGGAYASPVPEPPVNSICNRDVVLGIVFDCFYEPGGEAEAEGFQQDMQNLLADYSGTQEIRMLWGTFGDTNIPTPASASSTTTMSPGRACSSSSNRSMREICSTPGSRCSCRRVQLAGERRRSI